VTIPKPLRVGDTVAVIATSGPVNLEKLDAGVKVLHSMGLRVRIFESCFAQHEYLAGADALRLRDLHAAFADREIRAIFPARGGYGAARLLPHLDFDLIRKNPKIFAGYSDITALHIALNQCAGLATFHAPMVAADLADADDDTLRSFQAHLFANGPAVGGRPLFFPKNGVLTGGNLSVIVSLIGTPFEIDTCGKVLFLEEVGEAAYRVDRMLLQLKYAGKLRDAEGFVLGDFSGENIDLAIREILVPEGKPLVRDFPAGHCMPNFTLPLGRKFSNRCG